MILEFLAVVVAGFGAGGIAMILQKLTRQSLPDWTTPFGAALGMLGMIIFLEYTWAGRFEAGLPDGVEVVSRNETSAWYRPWTFAVPLSNRVIALDHRVTQRNAENPDLVMTGVILAERWALTFGFSVMFDCAQDRRADMTQGTELDARGVPVNAEWFALAPDDPFLTRACDTAPRLGAIEGGREDAGTRQDA